MDVESNTSLRKNAENRVKNIISTYISQIVGDKYTIEWRMLNTKNNSMEESSIWQDAIYEKQ